LILLLFAVTMTVILAGALSAKPVYQAAVRLQVIPMESEQVGLYGPIRTSTTTDVIDLAAYQFTQVVRSGPIAWRTIAQLGLNTDATRLLEGIRATQDYDFVTVIAEGSTPQEAEAIVTAQVENALASYRADRARPAVTTGEFITGQLAEAEQTLATAQAELLRFKLAHSLESLEREIVACQDIVRDLRRQQDNAGLEVACLTARIAALEGEATAAEDAARAVEDPRYFDSAQYKQGTVAESGEQANAARRAGDLRATIATLRGELAGQRAVQAELERAIARWETELASLIGLNDEHTRLANAVSQAQNTRDFLANKAMEARLKQQQGLSVGYLKVVEPARRPDQPLPGRTLQLALVGGLLSLVGGAVLAFLLELIEAPLRGPHRTRA
jgi:uncharacterized protein involved in exopolysaccharide biosynthesis